MTEPAVAVRVLRSSGGGYVLLAEQVLPGAPPDVFPFFADAHNLEALTPPTLRFRIRTPDPIAMAAGALIDYRLAVHGIPFGWRSRISVWEPPYRFVDEQLRGPYRWWVHEHAFRDEGGQTRMFDRVRFQPLGGALTAPLVIRDVRAIFRYRQERLAALLGG